MTSFIKKQKTNNGTKGRNQKENDKWEDGRTKLETKLTR